MTTRVMITSVPLRRSKKKRRFETFVEVGLEQSSILMHLIKGEAALVMWEDEEEAEEPVRG